MIRLRILSGTDAGRVLAFQRGPVTAGRHPSCDLRFAAHADLEVSARHAVFEHDGTTWTIRDIGSTNGTFVNGQPVTNATALRSGDRIALGAGGPLVEVEIAEPGSAPATLVVTREAPPESTTTRLRAAIARETRRLRIANVVLVLVLAALAGAFLFSSRRQQASFTRERAALLQRIDSILDASRETVRTLEGELAGLAGALDQSRAEVQRLRDALARAGERGDSSRVVELRRQLQAATAALERQQLAATLDFRAIQAANRHAVALVYVETADGNVVTGTAFAVRQDATLVTSRHVVSGADGRGRPRRIAVQFADSEQVFPARLLAVADDADLAIIRADSILGSVPTVRALATADAPAEGMAVAVIGFPLGGAPAPPGRTARLATPLVSAGVVRAVTPDRIELQGYGAAGASGSPIFDEKGVVVGVLFGGRRDAEGHTLFAVPVGEVSRLLGRL